MENGNFPVCVLGIGHLAAAVRVGLYRARSAALDDWKSCEAASPLFLACSDFENTALRFSLARRAQKDGANILFACVSGPRFSVGPLVSNYLTRSWDFSLEHSSDEFLCVSSPHVDTGVTQVAQIGATLLIRELAKIRLGERIGATGERVAKIDSPSGEVGCERESDRCEADCDETFVAGGVRWNVGRRVRMERAWHPTGLG